MNIHNCMPPLYEKSSPLLYAHLYNSTYYLVLPNYIVSMCEQCNIAFLLDSHEYGLRTHDYGRTRSNLSELDGAEVYSYNIFRKCLLF